MGEIFVTPGTPVSFIGRRLAEVSATIGAEKDEVSMASGSRVATSAGATRTFAASVGSRSRATDGSQGRVCGLTIPLICRTAVGTGSARSVARLSERISKVIRAAVGLNETRFVLGSTEKGAAAGLTSRRADCSLGLCKVQAGRLAM